MRNAFPSKNQIHQTLVKISIIYIILVIISVMDL